MSYEDDDYLDYDEEDDGEEFDDTFVTLACEDCDYRWKVPLDFENEDIDATEDAICPMCGSSNVVEI
jgi:Zn finger protein HypA/HybF involved in hydrogenase expression